jgi:thiol-disulfide isomerase/thioredoxin
VRDEPPQVHHTRLWIGELRLLAEYGLRAGLAAQAVVPFRIVDTRTRYTDLTGAPITLDYPSIHHHDETLAGVGDVQLLLHVAAVLGPVQAGVRAGVSLPTGTVHENPYLLGDLGLPHEHIQFGTGTFDPLLGADVARAFARWSVAGFAQAQLPLYQGRHGYQAGARFLAGVSGAAWRRPGGATLRLGAVALHERAERWDGRVPTDDGNQGRTDLFVGPGLTVPFGGDWSASLDLRVRAYGHTVNAQLDLPVVLDLSVGRLLHLERGAHGAGEGPAAAAGADRQTADVADAVTAGEAVPLAHVHGKWTVLDFWATWCEPCRALDAELRAFAAAHPEVAVRRVNVVDMDSPIARAELGGVDLLPHVRLLGPDGARAWQGSGSPAAIMGELRRRVSAGASP